MAFEIKQNDLEPAWEVPLRRNYGDVDEEAVDLTDADNVTFKMRQVGEAALKVDAAATIVGAATDGVVRYVWQDGDTDTVGAFRVEVEVEWEPGRTQTFPNYGYWDVTVFDDLD